MAEYVDIYVGESVSEPVVFLVDDEGDIRQVGVRLQDSNGDWFTRLQHDDIEKL